MLKRYPVIINNTVIPFPDSWNEDYEVIEEVNETEAGTEQVSVTRYGKMSVSASFSCTSEWVKRFRVFESTDILRVNIYDAVTEGYLLHRMRLRNLKTALEPGSENVSSTFGLWKVSFNLEEF